MIVGGFFYLKGPPGTLGIQGPIGPRGQRGRPVSILKLSSLKINQTEELSQQVQLCWIVTYVRNSKKVSMDIRPFKNHCEILRDEYCRKGCRDFCPVLTEAFDSYSIFLNSLEHLPTLSYQNDLNMLPFLLTKDMYISSLCFSQEIGWYLECNFELFFCDFFFF